MIERVLERGAWEGAAGPHHVQEEGIPHGPASVSGFVPAWLAPHCKPDPAYGPAPCPQPSGEAWVMAHKLRRVRSILAARAADADEMFALLDSDGGGSLDRKEVAVGLYRRGVWLRPRELQALLDALDSDGGGDIDAAEFRAFWQAYTFA